MSLEESREQLRRRVTWLRTTSATLPAFVRGALADEVEELLDQLDARDQHPAFKPNLDAVRDAVGEDEDDEEEEPRRPYVGLLPARVERELLASLGYPQHPREP